MCIVSAQIFRDGGAARSENGVREIAFANL